MNRDLEPVRRGFRHFAEMCAIDCPLYAELSTRILGQDNLLSISAKGQPGQPPPNLLLGAVQDLLLEGKKHPLAAYYPSLGGSESPVGAWPAFTDFCREFASEIEERVVQRGVQTNEVGRCGALFPAFALAWEHFNRRPIDLIEVGASAGLNLLFDRYRYEYSGRGSCGPESAPCIRVELLPERTFSLPSVMPEVADRVGIDIAPVDVMNESAIRWLQAMIWPDQVQRHDLFRAAVAIARKSPPRLVSGDGLDVLPSIVEPVSSKAIPCIFHSHSIYQMDDNWRARFEDMLMELGRHRELACVSLEWLGNDHGPKLHLSTYQAGKREVRLLAECHHHGAWVRWLNGYE